MAAGEKSGCWGKKMKTEYVGKKNEEKEGKRGKGKKGKRGKEKGGRMIHFNNV